MQNINNVVEPDHEYSVEEIKDDLYAKTHICEECNRKHFDSLLRKNCEDLCEQCFLRILNLIVKESIWKKPFNRLRNRNSKNGLYWSDDYLGKTMMSVYNEGMI